MTHKYNDIVICGSMSFVGEMHTIKNILGNNNIHAISPESDDDFFYNIKSSHVNIDEYKRSMSRQHITKIRRITTRAILVVNRDKYNTKNYIGGNTLAEIAFAFIHNKQIYLMYGIPDIYHDELTAWRAKPLYGDINTLINTIKTAKSEQLLLPGVNWDAFI